MKEANGFSNIYSCMEGRGLERQAKETKTIAAKRKTNQSTMIFRFAAKTGGRKGKRKALRLPSLNPFQDQSKVTAPIG